LQRQLLTFLEYYLATAAFLKKGCKTTRQLVLAKLFEIINVDLPKVTVKQDGKVEHLLTVTLCLNEFTEFNRPTAAFKEFFREAKHQLIKIKLYSFISI